MFKHIKASRLKLLLRIWHLERTMAILEDQESRVHVALRDTDAALDAAYVELRDTLPQQRYLPEHHHG